MIRQRWASVVGSSLRATGTAADRGIATAATSQLSHSFSNGSTLSRTTADVRWYSHSIMRAEPLSGTSEQTMSDWFGTTNTPPTTTCADGSCEGEAEPGSKAFLQCDREALIDLFHKYALDSDVSGRYLDRDGLSAILKSVGESCTDQMLEDLFQASDVTKNGLITLEVSSVVLRCVVLRLD